MARPTVSGKPAGFTYIGVLIAVALLGAALATVGSVWHTLAQREREQELLFIGNQFCVALNRYYQSHQRYPRQLDELVEDREQAVVQRHLRKLFIDPMTGQAEWGTVTLPDGQVVGVHSLSAQRPMKTAGFRRGVKILDGEEGYAAWVFMADGKTATQRAAAAALSPAEVRP